MKLLLTVHFSIYANFISTLWALFSFDYEDGCQIIRMESAGVLIQLNGDEHILDFQDLLRSGS